MRLIQVIKNFSWHFPKAIFWNFVYGFPSRNLKLIGVTGTDGKTTTVTLIHHLLVEAGLEAELVSTVTSPGLHTTSPSSRILQKTLSEFQKKGIKYVVLEVTAHGIDQFRFWGCHFSASLITNITHEHLDDFNNLTTYTQTKFKLSSLSDICFVNIDNPLIAQNLRFLKSPYKTFSIDSASNFRASVVKTNVNGLSFKINKLLVTTDTPYYYQAYNILSAFCVSRHLGIDDQIFLKAINPFPAISGRREEIPNNYGIKCIIDFAHTPQALESTLTALKKIYKGKIILIFGATGGRDPSKRPIMGQVISRLADHVILTTDDLRHEKLSDINRAIIAGFETNSNFTYQEAENRQLAFDLAITQAKKGDIVLACGKGHETTLLIGDTEYPWSEKEAFLLALKKRFESHHDT
ncbi:MAG: UDP-N-acetylmuramyl-tripeptide synthetase [Candidatus Shapirobacteria bacterium]